MTKRCENYRFLLAALDIFPLTCFAFFARLPSLFLFRKIIKHKKAYKKAYGFA